MRSETRRQRYALKANNCTVIPVEVACINFMCDDNAAFVIRAAACFGIKKVNIIGSLPKDLKRLSGTTNELVEIQTFANVSDFKTYAEKYGIQLVCAELSEDAIEINDAELPTRKACYIFGHEIAGIPTELLNQSYKVYIRMTGQAYCLNTSQTANIFMYEISKKYINQHEKA
jgi:tRNA G18 (ribose-2'-O)-methylase SpoU